MPPVTPATPIPAATAVVTAAAALREARTRIMLTLRLLRLAELVTLLALGHALLHGLLSAAGLMLALLVPLLTLHLHSVPGLSLLHPRHHVRLTALAPFELPAHRAFGVVPAFERLLLSRPVRLA